MPLEMEPEPARVGSGSISHFHRSQLDPHADGRATPDRISWLRRFGPPAVPMHFCAALPGSLSDERGPALAAMSLFLGMIRAIGRSSVG